MGSEKELAGPRIQGRRFDEFDNAAGGFWTVSAYEAWRMQKAAGSIICLTIPVLFGWIISSNVQWLYGRVTLAANLGGCLLFTVVVSCLWHFREMVQSSPNRCIILQVMLFLISNACLTLGVFVGAPQELAQHRIFLTSSLPVFSLFTTVGFLPRRMFITTICSIHFLTWVAFHVRVDCLQLPNVVCSIMVIGGAGLVHALVDRNEKESFKAQQAYAAEQEYLDAMQSCLFGVVSALFEASCMCDRHGKILSSAPQLARVLQARNVISDKQALKSDICQYLASATDERRLKDFLRGIVARPSCSLDTLSVTLSGEKLVNAKFFGIALPSRRMGRQSQLYEHIILVGLQTSSAACDSKDESTAPPSQTSCSTTVDSTTEKSAPPPPSAETRPLDKPVQEVKAHEVTKSPTSMPSLAKGNRPAIQRRGRFAQLKLDCSQVKKDSTVDVDNSALERFTDRTVIGRGAVGVVYSARRKADGQPVALKIAALPDFWRNAEEEFKMLQSIEHEHIVRAKEFFASSEGAVLCLELFNGAVLDAAIKRERDHKFSEDTSCRLFKWLLQAVCYLHQRRIIHRDIKPANVMIANDTMDLRLLDFNTARRLEEGCDVLSPGTLCFASPEVLTGESASEACDVWSCGLCLHLMLSGSMPWRKPFETPTELGDHITANPLKLSSSLWTSVSDEGKSVLRHSLMNEARFRPTAATLLLYEWFCKDVVDTSISSARKERSHSCRPRRDPLKHAQRPLRRNSFSMCPPSCVRTSDTSP
mmetsp:Transcript_47945/g.133659  ORF Transcript_47945/g.133659 Transcript_47945/m.133659 type:complete len:762 (-) Transcript_47945:90-2375(-)